MCVSYEGKFDVARKIKVDGAKGGGQKPDGGGGNGKGKKSTSDPGGVVAASGVSDDGFYNADVIRAGTYTIGEVIIDGSGVYGGVYTIDKLYSGQAYDGYAPTYGKVTLTGATYDTYEVDVTVP